MTMCMYPDGYCFNCPNKKECEEIEQDEDN